MGRAPPHLLPDEAISVSASVWPPTRAGSQTIAADLPRSVALAQARRYDVCGSARELAISVNTVKKYVWRALATLRAMKWDL